MTTQAIIESEMTFGPYPAGHCFYIEKSKCYQRIREGVQMVEFLLLRKNGSIASAIWVIEAKSSSPREITEANPESKFKFAFDEFIESIRVKLTNAFLQEAVQLALKPVIKTWGLPATSVAVMNEDLAKTYGLILPQVKYNTP